MMREPASTRHKLAVIFMAIHVFGAWCQTFLPSSNVESPLYGQLPSRQPSCKFASGNIVLNTRVSAVHGLNIIFKLDPAAAVSQSGPLGIGMKRSNGSPGLGLSVNP